MIIIEKVKEIFDQLQSTNSKLEKQSIIRNNKDNQQFTDTLKFLLSPYQLTGLSERKINKKVSAVRGVITSWENAIEYLSNHNTGTDHDIALIQRFIYDGNTYHCECGSGFSDDERVDYWNNPEKILNKIATIQYFEISKNDDGGYGLRFPVWTHRIREDKTEISMN